MNAKISEKFVLVYLVNPEPTIYYNKKEQSIPRRQADDHIYENEDFFFHFVCCKTVHLSSAVYFFQKSKPTYPCTERKELGKHFGRRMNFKKT